LTGILKNQKIFFFKEKFFVTFCSPHRKKNTKFFTNFFVKKYFSQKNSFSKLKQKLILKEKDFQKKSSFKKKTSFLDLKDSIDLIFRQQREK